MYNEQYPHAIRARLGRLGERLAAARLAKNWSQAELAQRIGTSRRTIVNIEAGFPGAAVGTVLHIAWLLQVPLDDAAARMPSISARRRAGGRSSAHKRADLEF
jgi:transcriptional regulator with XRE-family HTH domain